MEEKLAEQISLLAIGMNARLNEQLIQIQSECSEAEFVECRHGFGQVMGRLFTEILMPLYEKHPDLLPDSLGGHYVVPMHVLTGEPRDSST